MADIQTKNEAQILAKNAKDDSSLADSEELQSENERLLSANESLREELETIRSKKVILKRGAEHLIETLEKINRELQYPI